MSPAQVSRSIGLCPARSVTKMPTGNATHGPLRRVIRKADGNVHSALAILLAIATLPAIAADGPPAALDPAANHTRIVVIRHGKDGQTRPVVALANPTCTNNPDRLEDTYQCIFTRELMRQALLISARDELGLATRDEVLGDAIAANALAASDVELVTVFHTVEGKLSPAVIRRGEGALSQTLFDRDMGYNNPPRHDRRNTAEIAEELSRTEFPAMLKQLGMEGKPNAFQPDAGLPAGVEDRLSHLAYTDIFAAIRDLHEAMRTGGESPVRVAGLARGYTLLGLLTEHHWHPAHKVFKAGALLYAQRLVARDPKGAFALWHRAFAEALIGLHKDAEADIALARERAKAENKPNPAWAELLDAYASYDIVRMTVEQGPLSPLAALLRLMAVEYPVMEDLTLLAARDVLALAPECYRAHDAMCRVGGVSNSHQATTAGPKILASTLRQKLLALETLPEAVKKRVENAEGGETSISKLLSQAGEPGADSGEPSWAVLGRLVRETQFVHVFRRLYFMHFAWCVPVDEFWASSVPSVADHPYRPYLETMVGDRQKAKQSLADLIDHLDVTNIELSAYTMLEAIFRSEHPNKLVSWTFAVRHLDYNAHDLCAAVEHSDGLARSTHAETLLKFSPRCAYAKATLIENYWERAKPHIAEWEQDANKSPAILAALARRYTELGKYDDAHRALVRYIRFSPDFWAYDQLAKNYKERGDLEHWQSTLEEFLAKTEDHGLSHARVNVQLANHFIELKQWEHATRFAEAAATSGAAWAMMCAERCAEGREDWTAAESYAQQVAQRYPEEGWANWFFFCKRTGHGDLQSARVFAEQHLQSIAPRPGLGAQGPVGYFYWLSGDTKKAMTWFRKAYESTPNFNTCLSLIWLGDEIGDTETRDEAVRSLLKNYRRNSPRTCQIYEILRRTFGQPQPVSVDLKAVARILQTVPPVFQGLNAFVVGHYLKNHGKAGDARPYLKNAIKLPGLHQWAQVLAAEALGGLGDDKKAGKEGDASAKGPD